MLETILSLDYEGIIAAITTLVAAIAGIIAGFKNSEAKKNAALAEQNAAKAEENRILAQQTQAFFDPEDTTVTTPPENTPERSWKMSDSVKTFLLAGHDEEEKVSILEQVAEAEKAGLVTYTVNYKNGYYKISYGQINGHTAWGK